MQQQPAPATGKGKADWFIGDVHVDMIVDHPDARFSVGSVHFHPGSRNAWHSAAGQMLHCTDGVGLVVTDDDVVVLRPGVTVWTPPNQRHWHGAAPNRQMTHLAMVAWWSWPRANRPPPGTNTSARPTPRGRTRDHREQGLSRCRSVRRPGTTTINCSSPGGRLVDASPAR